MDLPNLPPQSTLDAGRVKASRRRVLHVAFACDPEISMEMRIGWQRAIIAAEEHDVIVLCGPGSRIDQLNAEAKKLRLTKHLQFIEVTGSSLSRMLCRTATSYYVGYRLWHKAAYQLAKKLHTEQPFDLVHQTTYCGFREPGECWKLDAPFVWGPVGGTQSFPLRYLTQLSPQAAWIEICRNAINFWQLRFSKRVRSAAKKSAVVISATQRAHDDLVRAQNVKSTIQLETAIDFPVAERRPLRDSNQPIKLLWSGRLRAWKTFPLLIKALAQLPDSVDYHLRVLGTGESKRRWKRLAKKHGVSEKIEWLGWPDYRETLSHYSWADAFVFTSMRDTSGTGLQEALAMGAPIIGVDHQGAADIMTNNCAIALPVDSPQQTIKAMASSIQKLATEPALWKQLSDGAIEEAHHMTWSQQIEPNLAWYREALQINPATASAKTNSASDNLSYSKNNQENLKNVNSSTLFDNPLESQPRALKSH